jgi:putative transposase
MAYKASAHAVYDLKYHIVWTLKYRKALLVGEVAQTVQELFYQIAAAYDLEIDTMEVMEDHVHVFLSAPPRYAPARIAHILKSLSARALFARFPRLRRQLWGGQFWEDGYFVRSAGDAVTAEIIRRYIRYQKSPQNVQLSLFGEGP